MKLTVNKNHLSLQAEQIMRKAGYTFINDRRTGKESFVRRLTSDFYPRFHVYVKDQGEKTIVDLHLDQKKASYQGTNAHSGEYEGGTVEKELERIKGFFRASFVG